MKEKDDEEPKPIFTPGKSFKDIIFEQIAGGLFLQYDRTTGALSTHNLIVQDGLEYKPLEKIPWPTACLPEVLEQEDPLDKQSLIEKFKAHSFHGEYGDTKQLFNETKDFFMEHLDVRNELLFDVYAAFVLMSWRMEDFKVVPYQMFLGPLASGKTRGLECFRYLGYRALSSVTMSAASIFRTLEAWHCLLLLDETEVYGRESMVRARARATEVTEEKPSMLDTPGEDQNTVKTEVSEQTEVSEVSLETLAKNTKSLQRLSGLFEDKCVVCGFEGTLDWQANKFDGSWGLLCDRCGLEVEKRLVCHVA